MVSLVVCDKQITSASSKFLDGCRDFNAKQINQDALIDCNYSVPLFEKEGLGEILLDKSPSAPFFKGSCECLRFN